MAFTSQTLAEIYDHIYQPSKKDGRYIWIQQTAHDGKPWGDGQLHTSATVLVKQIDAAAKVKASVHLCVSALSEFDKDSKRSALTSAYAAGIVLDIDFKDHEIPPDEVIELINKIDPIPTMVADTANGMHVYYLFEENIISVFGSVHRALAGFFGEQGVRVDPAHSSPKTTIRSIGSTGKSGDMIVGTNGVFGGPKYTLESLAAAIGLTEFEADPTGENLGYTEAMFSLRPQVSRQQLFHTCAAVAQFDADADTRFQSGAVSTYHDARMYASQISHTWLEGHYDITDMNERRDHAVRVLTQYPGHTHEKAEALYLSTLTTPSIRCHRWSSERYTSLCNACRYGGEGQKQMTSPVQNAINDEAVGLVPDTGEESEDSNAVINAQTMHVVTPAASKTSAKRSQGIAEAVLNVTNPTPSDDIPTGLRLPDNYFIGKNGTLFVKQPPPPDDEDGKEVIKPISNPAWVIDTLNKRQQSVSGQPLSGGYEGYVVGTNDRFDVGSLSLNGENELNKDLSNATVQVFHIKEARKYFGKLIDAGIVKQRPFVERLGWHRDKNKEHVFYQLGLAIKENEVLFSEPKGSLRTHFIGSNGDVTDVRPRGDVQLWRDNCLTPFVTDPHLSQHMLLVLSAFTAPLYGITGNESGPLLNFHGDTTTGKTTALAIANSVFAPPNRHLINARDTTVSLFHKIGLIQSLPVTLDEASTLDEDVMHDLCYQMTGGRDKSGMIGSSNGGHQLRQTNDWNTCVLSTANNSARSLISRKAGDNEAVYVRTIDIEIPSGPDVHNDANRKLMVKAAKVAEENFGCVGLMYLQEVVRERDAISNAYDHMHEQGLYRGAGRFLERHFALVKVVASLLLKLNMITSADMQHIGDTLLATAAASKSGKSTIITSTTPMYSDFLLELGSDAMPLDRKEYEDEYMPTISANSTPPKMNQSVWEDAGFFYCVTGYLHRYHSVNHPAYTRAQMIDEFNRQLQVQGLPEIVLLGARRVPITKGRVINSSSTVDTTKQRLHKIPKI